jgi:hypothetical protein
VVLAVARRAVVSCGYLVIAGAIYLTPIAPLPGRHAPWTTRQADDLQRRVTMAYSGRERADMAGANGISRRSITAPDWDVLRGGRDLVAPRM